jgi:hypothetical protein
MVWEKVGLNLTNLVNLSPPNITTPSTVDGIVTEMISQANSTGFWFEIIVLTSIYIIIAWELGNKNPLSRFKYSFLRASCLSLAITSILGINLLLSGLADSYRIVAIVLLLNIMNAILVIANENKE